MSQAHFGVMTPQIKRSWADARRAATAFEEMGYDSIWVNDHLYGPQSPSIPILEAWSEVAALAASTERVEIGTLVTPAGMRNPAHLGKVIATVDQISDGRIIAGIGAGWMPREYTDFNMPFPNTRDRLGQMREAVELLRGMWDEDTESLSYDGQYFRTENLVCLPKPARRVPLLIGGGGEKVTLKLAARHADIWNNAAGMHEQLEHKIGVLRGHCEAVGRDPAEITISQQVLVTLAADEASAAVAMERAQRIFGGHMGDPAGPIALTGTPERVAERVQKHIDLGCTMFMMEFFGRDTVEPARLFAEQVLPHFR
jgi:alkanesulfonate monooxygenase SsuD/methylene tetrahydromethanopterin reductase-like flavin-dependent oxidoreductase (luciferase family)